MGFTAILCNWDNNMRYEIESDIIQMPLKPKLEFTAKWVHGMHAWKILKNGSLFCYLSPDDFTLFNSNFNYPVLIVDNLRGA